MVAALPRRCVTRMGFAFIFREIQNSTTNIDACDLVKFHETSSLLSNASCVAAGLLAVRTLTPSWRFVLSSVWALSYLLRVTVALPSSRSHSLIVSPTLLSTGNFTPPNNIPHCDELFQTSLRHASLSVPSADLANFLNDLPLDPPRPRPHPCNAKMDNGQNG